MLGVPDHTAGVHSGPGIGAQPGGNDVSERDRAAASDRARALASRRAVKGGSLWRMRNWRLRTKLIAVLFVPTLTALVLGGLRVKADLDRAAEFRQTVSQVEFAQSVTSLVQELQKERTLSVARVAVGRGGPRTDLDAQIGRVDQTVNEAQAAANRLDADADQSCAMRAACSASARCGRSGPPRTAPTSRTSRCSGRTPRSWTRWSSSVVR